MVDRAARALSLPDDWPAHPDLSLVLNRMGALDWDLASGLMHMDAPALEVFDVRPEEYDGRPESLAFRVPPEEGARLDAMVAAGPEDGSDHYGAYFRIRRRDGSLRWTHTQGRVRRDGKGRPVPHHRHRPRRHRGAGRRLRADRGRRSSAAGRPASSRAPPPRSPTPGPCRTSSTCSRTPTVSNTSARRVWSWACCRGGPHPSGRGGAGGLLRPGHPLHPGRRAVPDE